MFSAVVSDLLGMIVMAVAGIYMGTKFVGLHKKLTNSGAS